MRIGIIGMGSIGQRHARCLKELGYTDIVALRTRKGTSNTLPEDISFIKEFNDQADFYSTPMDCVIISNPTSLHVGAMLAPLEKKIPIFVEKPISDSLGSLKELNELDTSRVLVGYCLRHNDLIKAVKSFISSGRLGKIHKASLYCGHYLPLWHPEADYREEYTARKDLGGGALRTLSHELDLMNHLFGNVKTLCASIDKFSDLEIDVDDSAFMMCRMEDGAMVNIELDLLNPISTRHGTIYGSKGILHYSFNGSRATFTSTDGTVDILYDDPELDRNKMYISQIKDLIAFINKENSISCDYEGGVAVMKIINKAERSSQKRSCCDVKEEDK